MWVVGKLLTPVSLSLDSTSRRYTTSVDVEGKRACSVWTVLQSDPDNTVEIKRGDIATPTAYTITTYGPNHTQM